MKIAIVKEKLRVRGSILMQIHLPNAQNNGGGRGRGKVKVKVKRWKLNRRLPQERQESKYDWALTTVP